MTNSKKFLSLNNNKKLKLKKISVLRPFQINPEDKPLSSSTFKNYCEGVEHVFYVDLSIFLKRQGSRKKIKTCTDMLGDRGCHVYQPFLRDLLEDELHPNS